MDQQSPTQPVQKVPSMYHFHGGILLGVCMLALALWATVYISTLQSPTSVVTTGSSLQVVEKVHAITETTPDLSIDQQKTAILDRLNTVSLKPLSSEEKWVLGNLLWGNKIASFQFTDSQKQLIIQALNA